MNRIIRLLPLLLLAISGTAVADDLTVTATDWPPYISSDLYRDGVVAVVTAEAFRRAGYGTSMTIENWPAALEKAEDGVYDVIAAIWQTDKRSNQMLFSEPFLKNYIVFIKRADSAAQFRVRADLDGLRIGVVEDYAYSDQPYDTAGITIAAAGSVKENIDRLLANELDLVLADSRVAAYEINKMAEAKNLTLIRNPLLTRGLRIAVSRQNPRHVEIISAFNYAIAEMQDDGSYNEILATFRVSQ
jgi:polar amino acid transport system substrate-binding protein